MPIGSPSNLKASNIDLDDKYIRYSEIGLESDSLWGWGENQYGQLGDGTIVGKSSPTQIGSVSTWKEISSLNMSMCIKTDGTLWGTGDNTFYQFGNGTNTATSTFIQIGSGTNWKQICVGWDQVGAIKTDGTLWMWGINAGWQLGNGLNTTVSTPIQIGSGTNWKQVSCGQGFTAGIKTDGTMWTWGAQAAGWWQLGDGSGTAKSTPIQIGSANTWNKIATGFYHSVAIRSDGTLWTWGYNNANYWLGDGTTIPKSTPVQIGSANTWVDVKLTVTHALGLKSDGSLWAWGDNTTGQLGQNNMSIISTPVQIGTLTNWVKIGCSINASYAIKTDGTLWSWGFNDKGQLGNSGSTSLRYSSPVQIGSLTNWASVAGGYKDVISLKY